MAKAHISPNNATDKTIRSIDRKREQERRFMLQKARENADEFAAKLVQRLIDKGIVETTSVQSLHDTFEEQLKKLANLDEFEIQLKVAPVRTLVPDPNIISLYLTQFIIEDLINHSAIQDIYGEDLEIYLTTDSIFKTLRPQ
ncbi:MAG: hypothetical protein KKB91_08635 [Proteobacteria bacterium]|jgi:hypothetical protein|nr:hypothetical protein [Desulfocapsa sp.]MBU3944549.1 hypothetical protein [Pseudomonadota bacterium]MCG2744136.1 hypothetical protein [Desulfobacteraceae bacterium]MDO8947493.1 hypothetical protein [Desulfocapsaceae bacterium]MBU3982085.1 hypothetical protein [Pseudomonadota bacterium]